MIHFGATITIEGLEKLSAQLLILEHTLRDRFMEASAEVLRFEVANPVVEYAEKEAPWWTGTLALSHRADLYIKTDEVNIDIYPDPTIRHPVISSETVGDYAPRVALRHDWWENTVDYADSLLEDAGDKILYRITQLG